MFSYVTYKYPRVLKSYVSEIKLIHQLSKL